MTRYYFDETDGTLDEIDEEEELRREEARAEAREEDFEALKEREYYDAEDGAKARAERKEREYWSECERRRYELADKLLAHAYGQED